MPTNNKGKRDVVQGRCKISHTIEFTEGCMGESRFNGFAVPVINVIHDENITASSVVLGGQQPC